MSTNTDEVQVSDDRTAFKELRASLARLSANTSVPMEDRVMILSNATYLLDESNRLAELQSEIDRLNAIINTPHADDFIRAVSIEAEHQRQRWGAEGDAGKAPADWFWLVGYLAGKALHACASDNAVKTEHHIITTAAALANWHRTIFGKTDMRPGIDAPVSSTGDQS
jgi:hypothetical protein